jgi:UDPglucose--hexose-1-phosphate uridylyltransferase
MPPLKSAEIRESPGRPWVIVAPDRRRRTAAFAGGPPVTAATCPFCPGHEHETPPEISRITRNGEWIARVVPNKYPASEAHEVIIESRDHDTGFEQLTQEHAAALIELYVERFAANAARQEVIVFKNEGRIAGASMPHPHSQVIALDRRSPRRANETSAKGCGWCDVQTDDRRLISRTASFSVVSPFAPAFAYEMAIVPHEHEPSFAAIGRKAQELARLMQQAVRGIRNTGDRTGYNWIFHNASHPFHWYLEITPRLTIPGDARWPPSWCATGWRGAAT